MDAPSLKFSKRAETATRVPRNIQEPLARSRCRSTARQSFQAAGLNASGGGTDNTLIVGAFALTGVSGVRSGPSFTLKAGTRFREDRRGIHRLAGAVFQAFESVLQFL